MSIIDYELEEIRKLCENVVPGSKIITCTAVLVRVDIKLNEINRQLTVCLRFPAEYPHQPILVEIKSRTLCSKFVDGLANLCEVKAKEAPGKPQCLLVLKFVEQYLRENPLCVALDEILELKRSLGKEEANEHLKLRQKSATVLLNAKGGAYFYRVKAVVPDDYPQRCIVLQDPETNLPAVLLRYLNGQSREIARQCVEAPLRLAKDKNAPTFQPAPSLYKTLKFCIEATKDFHAELCPICEQAVLPADPQKIELDDSKDAFVERVYCGHIFHQGCLKKYLQKPPFPKGGKLCPAKKRHPRSDARYYLGGGIVTQNAKQPTVAVDDGGTCSIRLAHDRWVVSAKVAETRWAQKQARERELQEVVDFLQ